MLSHHITTINCTNGTTRVNMATSLSLKLQQLTTRTLQFTVETDKLSAAQ